MSLEEAYRLTKQRRIISRPRVYLLQALTEYETKLAGKEVTSWSDHTVNGITKRMPDFIMQYYREFYLYQEFSDPKKDED